MKQNLADEHDYPHLAEVLRNGAKAVIGENHDLGTFAHLIIERETFTVSKMRYANLTEVLQQLDWHAAEYIEKHW